MGLGTASVSALEAFDSGLGYAAVGSIDPRPYVPNPGYANPLGNAVMPRESSAPWTTSCKAGAYRTDNITRTDLALDWAVPVYRGAELFVHAQLFNVFNEKGVVAVDLTVLTASDSPQTLSPFNPFTQTPQPGVNYRLGPNFGKPTSSAGYQSPRTFQFGVGLRF